MTPCTEEKGQEKTKKLQPEKDHHRETPRNENEEKVRHQASASEDLDTQIGAKSHQEPLDPSTEETRRTKARPIGTSQVRTHIHDDHKQMTEEKEALAAQPLTDQPDEERHKDQAQEKKEDNRREDQAQEEKTQEKTDAAKTEDQAEKDATATEATAATEKKEEMMTEDQGEKSRRPRRRTQRHLKLRGGRHKQKETR